ncbi:hypothetical protein NQ318_008833 [Aromia moschata]|uniref:PH domain-containing protein n=1 Tax=Aromia moschata TaxID=1265417 RepID=A0AAV8ZC59_9CUCU|nr:hypothetical protein NQ318_008833 [Aromia moschata]
MDDGESSALPSERRNSFSGRLRKQLRLSKRKPKARSFVSYSDESDLQATEFISAPTNFQRRDICPEALCFDHVSIQECPFDVTGYGRLIMKDTFKLRRPKRKKLTVFLFEQIVIFTKAKKQEDLYYYYSSIKISNLSIAPLGRNATKILLRDFVNSKLSKHDIEYKLEAATAEIQNRWRDALEKCLWQQLVRARAKSGFCPDFGTHLS